MTITQSITTICGIGLLLFLGQLLVPWFAELSGEAERAIQAKLDAESCVSYKPLYINNVLFCQCSNKEAQKPGKCSEKYK